MRAVINFKRLKDEKPPVGSITLLMYKTQDGKWLAQTVEHDGINWNNEDKLWWGYLTPEDAG